MALVPVPREDLGDTRRELDQGIYPTPTSKQLHQYMTHKKHLRTGVIPTFGDSGFLSNAGCSGCASVRRKGAGGKCSIGAEGGAVEGPNATSASA
jgi:hypothetical protein